MKTVVTKSKIRTVKYPPPVVTDHGTVSVVVRPNPDVGPMIKVKPIYDAPPGSRPPKPTGSVIFTPQSKKKILAATRALLASYGIDPRELLD
jgi:hypothetical protein